MTDVDTLVGAFKREVAIPGTFTTAFPTITDVDAGLSLQDAFAQAQLDGFFGKSTLDPTTGVITPDLSLAGGALIVIYAGLRLVRQQLRDLKTATRYKAGPTSYEVEQSAAMLTEDLKQLERRRKDLLSNAMRAGRGAGTTFVLDAYAARAGSWSFYGGFFPSEISSGVYGVG